MIGKDYEYNAMANSERTLWWYRCLHALTLRQIKKYSDLSEPAILDAGSGTGGLVSFLQDHGYSNVDGFDISAYAVDYANRNYGLHTWVGSILEVDATRTPRSQYDIIVSNDVICMLPDGKDGVALDRLLALLRPGGILIMNLPALRAGRGTHDIAVGIAQRYSRKSIRALTGTNAVVRSMLYWPFFLSPIIFGVRWWQRRQLQLNKNREIVSDVKNPPGWINNLFYGLTSLENRLLPAKPWGSSLLTVWQKPLFVDRCLLAGPINTNAEQRSTNNGQHS
ncbi:MAG: class I SAM-dependent methyltransferase [Bacteroidetes bacterium]|nr:class I SAM-dependent methyltransferase [Bacteroidota bacterium]